MGFVAFLFAIVAGAANPFQSATNAELNKQLHSPVWAGVVVYATGLLGLLAVQACVRQAWPGGGAHNVSWWAWTGGLISIVSTLAGLMLAQKLGSGTFMGLTLTAGMVTSVVLDHFGIVGMRQHTASPMRMVGCGLLVAGIWLVAKF